MTKHSLDFSLVPDLSRTSVLYRISDALEAQLSAFPETYNRAWGAVHFGYNISGGEGTLRAVERDFMRAREAHLRAALAEFVGMEEALPRDLARLNDARPPIKSTDTTNPLPHVIRELRNLELHLHSSTIGVREGIVYWQPPGAPDREELPQHSWYIDNVRVQDFARLRNAGFYDHDQLAQLVEWFNEAQIVWGVQELIRLAVEDYGGRIIGSYASSQRQER